MWRVDEWTQPDTLLARISAPLIPAAQWFDNIQPLTAVWCVILALLLSVIGIALYRLRGDSIQQLDPPFFFWLGMAYLAVLFLSAGIYLSAFRGVKPLADLLPIAVPWFGALGAVTISLEGVFLHNERWDKKYNYWHIGRPLFGAVLGIVAFFIMVLTVKASGETPGILKNQQTSPVDGIVYYILAFLVGYREETFRELIKRATDLILGPATAVPGPGVPSILFQFQGEPVTAVHFGDVDQTSESSREILIQNLSAAPLTKAIAAIVLPTAAAGVFRIESNPLNGTADIPANGSRKLSVVFKPGGAGNFSGKLTIGGENVAPRELSLSGAGI